MPAESVHIIGVRHHSPACARLVLHRLRTVRPEVVLIEGPADFNPRIAELGLAGHRPPLALFSFHFSGERRHASWSPFCAHSPEWVALRWALDHDVTVRFIDLPAWAVPTRFDNRYADRHLRDPLPALESGLGELGQDAVWDAAFEHPEPVSPPAIDHLSERLRTYFDGLRACVPQTPSDALREAFMGAHVGFAASDSSGPVVVVCGGFHAPVLRAAEACSAPPVLPMPPEEARHQTWLVPYSEARLDSFTGYSAGMPSPAWYRWLWSDGAESAARAALRNTATHLRDKGQPVSVADTIAAFTQARALARLRGHAEVARVDLLDAVVSTWVKGALDQPVPWSRRQVLQPGTHPVVEAVLASMSGDARGALDPVTPLPPLVHHVQAVLEQLDLRAGPAPRTLTLFVGEAESEPRRLALERLLVLGVGGYVRVTADVDASPQQVRVEASPHHDASLLEAAAYGPTLASAAAAVVEEQAGSAEGVAGLVHLLRTAVRAGLPTLSARALAALGAAVESENRLGELASGLVGLVGLVRHAGLSAADCAGVLRLVDAGVRRVLWLVEGIQGDAPLARERVAAVAAVAEAVLQLGERLETPSGRVDAVLLRLARAPGGVPADLRGAALGALLRLDHLSVDVAASMAVSGIEGVAVPGDWLVGLLTVGRAELLHHDTVVNALDEAVSALDADVFQAALPSLRVAFRAVSPRERAAFAERIAARHGARGVRLSRRLHVSAEVVARARSVEGSVDATLAALQWSEGR